MKAERGEFEFDPDWLFHNNAEDVIFNADVIEASNWACLPVAGGLDDQPHDLILDVLEFFRIKAYIRAELTEGDRG